MGKEGRQFVNKGQQFTGCEDDVAKRITGEEIQLKHLNGTEGQRVGPTISSLEREENERRHSWDKGWHPCGLLTPGGSPTLGKCFRGDTSEETSKEAGLNTGRKKKKKERRSFDS